MLLICFSKLQKKKKKKRQMPRRSLAFQISDVVSRSSDWTSDGSEKIPLDTRASDILLRALLVTGIFVIVLGDRAISFQIIEYGYRESG